jgi:cytochrome bd ubiquinol oxidase subunit I
MQLDPTVLSRWQFAFTVTYHIIFPAFTIGLSAFIATLTGCWLFTRDERYHDLARFWTKIFAISFAMGVVSGLVLSYEFGTNWAHFSVVAGNVIGPLLAYEVLTAFFLEATFLGIMLFGHNRVPPWLHFLASIMVAVGTATSAFWILSANSWMQVPAGYVIKDGVAYPDDWLKLIFNPTFPYRFVHMVIAAYLTTAVVVMAVGARLILAGRYPGHAGIMLKMGLGLALFLAPVQIWAGDEHGLATAKYQPAKLAAIEAHWDSAEVPGLVLFGWPDEKAERNDYALSIPHGAALIVTHEWDGHFEGLKQFPPEDRPPVVPVFFAFRIMVAIGFALLGLVLWGAYLWYRRKLSTDRLFLNVAALSWPLGFLAIISGWMVTEIGRQPWIATGILRTAEAASPVTGGEVAISLALFVLVYGIVFSTGIYYINRLINAGPSPAIVHGDEALPSRPLSGATHAAQQAAQGGTLPTG